MSDEIEIRKQVINEVLAEFQKNCQRTYFKTVRIEVYCEPKCPYCDENRYIHVTAPKVRCWRIYANAPKRPNMSGATRRPKSVHTQSVSQMVTL